MQKNFFKAANTKHPSFTQKIQDRPLKEAVKDLNLSKEKQDIVLKILDASAMETLSHYSDSTEPEKQALPGFVRKYFDKLIFSTKTFEAEIQSMFEKDEASKNSILEHISLFVSNGIYTLDAWKSLSLTVKKQDFSPIFKNIDIEIIKTTKFYEQISRYLGSKSLNLLTDASFLMSAQVYNLDNWFDISKEQFERVTSITGIPNELNVIYVVHKIAKMRATHIPLSELLAIEKKEQKLLFDELMSRDTDLETISKYVIQNEKSFIEQSQLHQTWGLIAFYGASGVGKTRLAHSFVEKYQQKHKNRVIFDVYAKQSNGLRYSSFSSVVEFVKYLLVVAVFANHFDFSRVENLLLYLQLLNQVNYNCIIAAARLFHNLNDRFDVVIRIDEFQLLFSEPRREAPSYLLSNELMSLSVLLSKDNVFLIPIIYGTWTFSNMYLDRPFPTSSWRFYPVPIGFLKDEDAIKLITSSVRKDALEYIKNDDLLKLLNLFGAFGRLVATIVEQLNSYKYSNGTTANKVLKQLISVIFDYFKYNYSSSIITSEIFLLILQRTNISTLNQQKLEIVEQNVIEGAIVKQGNYISCSFGVFLCYLNAFLPKIYEQFQEQLLSWVSKPTWQFFEQIIPIAFILKYHLLRDCREKSISVKAFFKGNSPVDKYNLHIKLEKDLTIVEYTLNTPILTPSDLMEMRSDNPTPCYIHIGNNCETCDGIFLFENCTVLMQYKLRNTMGSDIPTIIHQMFISDNVADKETATKFKANDSFIRCQYNALYDELRNEPNLYYCFVSNAPLATKGVNFKDGTAVITVKKQNEETRTVARIVDSRSIILDSVQDTFSILRIPKRGPASSPTTSSIAHDIDSPSSAIPLPNTQ